MVFAKPIENQSFTVTVMGIAPGETRDDYFTWALDPGKVKRPKC
jgi:hypothetical protein